MKTMLVSVIVLAAAPVGAQSVDSFNPVANSAVRAMVVQADGRVVLGGYFGKLSGQTHLGIGRVNADGNLDNTFNAGVTGSSAEVDSLAIQDDGRILVAGGFSSLDGQASIDLGRLNPDGSLDATFKPSLPYTKNLVNAVAVQADGKIIIGGYFITYGGGSPAMGVRRLNADGRADTDFTEVPITGSQVFSLTVQPDEKILVGGAFTSLCGQSRTNIGRVNSDGSLDTNFNSKADSTVWAMAVQPDGKIVVGGGFQNLGGAARAYIGRLNADGSLDPTLNLGAGGPVYTLAMQTDGKTLVGGAFLSLARQTRHYLGRLNADGSLDTTFSLPGIQSTVYGLGLQTDAKVLAGGDFTMLATKSRSYVGRVTNTSPATESLTFDGWTIDWQRGGAGPEVWRTSFAGSTNGTDWLSLGAGTRVSGGWQLSGLSLPGNATIRARGYVAGGYMNASSWWTETVIGAPFVTQSPTSLTNNAATTAVFSAGAVGEPTLTYQWLKDGVPLSDAGNASGTHTALMTLSNVLMANAAAYSVIVANASGCVTSQVATLTVMDPAINSQPADQPIDLGQTAFFTVGAGGTPLLAYQWVKDGTVLAGATKSTLTVVNAQPEHAGIYWLVASNVFGCVTSGVARLTVNRALLDTNFNPGAGAPVFASAMQADGKIIVGGVFGSLAGQPRTNLTRLNPEGGLDADFNPGADSDVYVLAVQTDGKVLVGGAFSTLGGQPCTRIGRLNTDGSLDTNFNASADWYVESLAVQPDGKILVGGNFGNLCGSPQQNLGRLNPDGSLDARFAPVVDMAVYTIALQSDGGIVVGGFFTSINGQPRNYIGRVTCDGTLDTSFNPGANNEVEAVVVQPDGRILVGGGFTMLGGQARSRLGRLNPDGGLDAAFNPGASSYVYSLAIQSDGKILAGGSFVTLGGQTRNYLGRLEADGCLDAGFNPGANSYIVALALQADGKILVGGDFSVLDNQPRSYIGRLNNSDAASVTLSVSGPGGATVSWLRGGSSPEVWRTTLDFSPDGTNWVSAGPGTRIAGGWQWTSAALTTSAAIRARGFVLGGYSQSSDWFVESILHPFRILVGDGNSGCAANQFRFTVSGVPGPAVVIETSTNLATWVPLRTNLTTGLGQSLFSEPLPNPPSPRFYRASLRY